MQNILFADLIKLLYCFVKLIYNFTLFIVIKNRRKRLSFISISYICFCFTRKSNMVNKNIVLKF